MPMNRQLARLSIQQIQIYHYLIFKIMTKIAKKGPAFLLKTYDMVHSQDFKEIIGWNHQGTGFLVYDAEKLANQVLPAYFKHSNMHSFIRQLNMYGFNKTRGKNSENYYFHPSFKRGQKNLVYQMQRKVQKKGSKRQCGGLSNQNISIQIQHSQDNQKENNQDSKNQRGAQSLILQNQIREKVEVLLNLNKFLIFQQFCHLKQAQKLNENLLQQEQTYRQQLNVNQCFIKSLSQGANEYLKINFSILESIKNVCEKKLYSKNYINQTQLSISKGQIATKNYSCIDVSKNVQQCEQDSDKIKQNQYSLQNQEKISCSQSQHQQNQSKYKFEANSQ